MEEEVVQRYQDYAGSLPSLVFPTLAEERGLVPSVGCYAEQPLRYGDFTGDGQSELVIPMGVDLVVFSPAREQVIFSTRLYINDWLDLETSREIVDQRDYGDRVQYQSHILENAPPYLRELTLAGYRGHAKLYWEDIDGDGQQDLLVWRKLYESRLRNDPKDGFKLLRDTFLYYKLIDGEYQLQEMESDDIRDWLAEQNLTWTDGWPNQSECEGEEGQLIPEMHDPLLNDPNVLQ